MEEKQSSGDMERKQEEFQASIFQDGMTLDSEISEVESELRVAEEESRPVAMERRKTEAKGLSVMDIAGVDVGWEAASGAQSSKAKVWSPAGPGVDWKGSLGDQSSISSVGGSQKKRKAPVRKESAETHEYESCETKCGQRKKMRAQDFMVEAVTVMQPERSWAWTRLKIGVLVRGGAGGR